ncbi:MAG TPA: lysophospholipid acyltransferase family protein [Candidatus Omnitrophota bacterium]|nr:lysophospholipid acyltransferase family protein [Candidatus Omnitrophota bacterium]HPB68120.1 lysophospholipid acyltransferase family protein [Candidatus Omnitrophota bacterium]HQO57502.1 lysophospholipid acyltransferase family protein [Candidatus Omnitrophota bacterium]
MFKFILYKFGQFLVNRLPLRMSYRLAIFVSDLHYLFSFRDRRAVRSNLRIILPEKSDVEWNVREVFRNFGRYLVEFFRMANEIDGRFIKERVVTENLHYIDEALKKGKGAILLSGHIGNWELGGVLLSLLGYPSVAIALPHKERPVNDLFNKQREARGLVIVPPQAATRRCLSILNKNKIIAVVADRSFGPNGFILDFLGKKSLFPKGPAIFSVKTGAPIVPVFLVRAGEGRFRIIVHKPIDPGVVDGNGRINEGLLKNLIKKYIRIIEQMIRAYPDQWLMFRDYSVEETYKVIREIKAESAAP